MRNARASTDAMVSSASSSCLTVFIKTRAKRATGILSTMAERSAANKQAVPGAESQLNVYGAPYGEGLDTTGGTRKMTLCSPGQVNNLLAKLSFTCRGL